MASGWAAGSILLGLVVLSAAATLFIAGPNYLIDDSFISFRYARELAEGAGLVFNLGERCEGYTNFLWTLLMAAAQWMGFQLLPASRVLGFAAEAMTLLAAWRLGLAFGASPLRALVAPALLATQLSFLIYPMTGMETSAHAAFLTWAVALASTQGPRRGRAGPLLLAAALLGLSTNRFDGIWLAVAIGVAGAVAFPDRRRWSLVALAAGVPYLGYQCWRIAYYGALLPNTFSAKLGGIRPHPAAALRYLLAAFGDGPGLHVILFALVFLLLAPRSRAVVPASAALLAQAIYVVLVGGDWMPLARFWLPVLPCALVLAQLGFWTIYDRVAGSFQRARPRWAPRALLVVAMVAASAGPLARCFVDHAYRDRRLRVATSLGLDEGSALLVGRYLARRLPSDQTLAIEWAGIVPYMIPNRVLDLFGLNDLDIPRQAFKAASYGRYVTPDYVRQRAPELVAPCVRVFDGIEAARRAASPEGVCGRYRPELYAELVRSGDYVTCIVPVGEPFYWPAIARRGSAAAGLCSDGAGAISQERVGGPADVGVGNPLRHEGALFR